MLTHRPPRPVRPAPGVCGGQQWQVRVAGVAAEEGGGRADVLAGARTVTSEMAMALSTVWLQYRKVCDKCHTELVLAFLPAG